MTLHLSWQSQLRIRGCVYFHFTLANPTGTILSFLPRRTANLSVMSCFLVFLWGRSLSSVNIFAVIDMPYVLSYLFLISEFR